ncbi:MAG: aminotransferase class V-fold PLP-dependent enzyme [Candidatus Latescibacteria bacterium]|nr:aminotransferase class V-fold PLP-dependent enzyme [Candidatus Latescibacterota bacterium]
MDTPIYLDNLATTPVDPRVAEAMQPYFTEFFGNPSSQHAFGWKAAEAVEEARAAVVQLVGARRSREVIFTSGATEANNLAIKGVVQFAGGGHVVTCATEHNAVLDCCQAVAAEGGQLSVVEVDQYGCIDLERLEAELRDDTVLISVMAANNEIGTLQPLAEIGALARRRGILWHCDGAQAVAKTELNVEALGIDLLSLSGHKIYGPKGVGALYVRGGKPRIRLAPQVEGGGQERGLRSGTLNVPAIVGLGRAAQIGAQECAREAQRLQGLRQRLHQGIDEKLAGVLLNGHPTQCLPGALHLSFAHIDGSELLLSLADIALSSGAACHAGTHEPSHVLRALGVADDMAQASLRFGIGRFNTEEQIEYCIRRVVEQVEQLRAQAVRAA